MPVIDVSGDEAVVADKLVETYSGLGFGYIIGHGIDPALVDAVFDASHRFHAQPLKSKMAVAVDSNHRGYIPIDESTDRTSTLADVSTPNQSASFMMMNEAGADDPDVRNGVYLAGANQWPDVPGFRSALTMYDQAMGALCGRLVGLMLVGLGFAADALAEPFDRPTTWLRLLHYPPSKRTAGEGFYGSAPHRDFGAITMLAQDGVGGLEARSPEGQWVAIEPLDGAFVMNTGSMMRRWSNGRLVATPHRVVSPPHEERYSCAFFYDPHMSTSIEPLGSGPARFEPVVFGDFVRRELTSTYVRHGAAGPETTDSTRS